LKLTSLNSEHLDYERLCILVATAEASPDELERFKRHSDGCPTCQRNLVDYGMLAAAMLDTGSDEAAESGPRVGNPVQLRLEAGRGKLLDRLQQELSSGSPAERRRPENSQGLRRSKLFGQRSIQAAAIAAGLLIGLGVLSWRKSFHDALRPFGNAETTKSAPLIKQQVGAPRMAGQVSSAESESRDIARLKQELTERATLAQQATLLLSKLKEDRDRLLDDLEDARTKQALAQQKVVDLETAREQTSGGLANAQAELATLADKLRSEDALLARQQRLLAVDAEIHNVLGDPDLQVLDVQTVNVRGQVEHPFGRVFFAPRKALVVYAFDLNQRNGARPGERFEVWGNQGQQMAGGYRLGALELDQKDQNRWILRCDDETVLSHIDSVYVTVVGAGPLPATKPVLRAFLSADAQVAR
jgi:hypothetical protein